MKALCDCKPLEHRQCVCLAFGQLPSVPDQNNDHDVKLWNNLLV